MEKQQKMVFRVGMGALLLIVLVTGISYAWLSLTLPGTKSNVLKAGSLSMKLTDANPIQMEEAMPVLDTTGKAGNPYTFTLENNGTIPAEYTIYLDDVVVDPGETRMPDGVLSYQLVRNNKEIASAVFSTVESDGTKAQLLSTGVLDVGQSYSYELRIWINSTATNSVMGQVYKGKLRIEAIQIKQLTASECFTMNGSIVTDYVCGKDDATYYKDIVIPYGVTEIKADAFASKGLNSVTIPNSVMTIGDNAFIGNELTSVIIKEKQSKDDFTTFPSVSPFGWKTGSSDANITWGA